jgi:hypothetical protein
MVAGAPAASAMDELGEKVRAVCTRIVHVIPDSHLEVTLQDLLDCVARWAYGANGLPEHERLEMELRLRRWQVLDSYALRLQVAYRRSVRRKRGHAADKVRRFMLRMWLTKRRHFKLVGTALLHQRNACNMAASRVQRAWRKRLHKQPSIPASALGPPGTAHGQQAGFGVVDMSALLSEQRHGSWAPKPQRGAEDASANGSETSSRASTVDKAVPEPPSPDSAVGHA